MDDTLTTAELHDLLARSRAERNALQAEVERLREALTEIAAFNDIWANVAAAAIRNERWRFSYGRKATPARIADFPLPHDAIHIQRIEDYLARAARVEDQMLEDAEDALDSTTARARLAELANGTIKLVSGAALATRLAALSDD